MSLDETSRWNRIADSDPYFGVLVEARYRGRELSGPAREAFFASGREHVTAVLGTIHQATGEARWSPAATAPIGRILDIGCGVGRITLPLAEHGTETIGVDISPVMLREAEGNARHSGITTAGFVLSDPDLSRVTGEFSLVHSYITFQHIDPAIGLRLMRSALSRLNPAGIAMVHVTTFTGSRARVGFGRLRQRFPWLNRRVNQMRGWPPEAPFIPMHAYRPEALAHVFEQAGVRVLRADATDHGGHRGLMYYLQRY